MNLCMSLTVMENNILNQSLVCGKGVDLGLFPSDSLESQSNDIIEIAHIGLYHGVE